MFNVRRLRHDVRHRLMQTFLPYDSYVESARCLDDKRLGKQRVECKQILLALGVSVGEHVPKSSSWRNHPAVRMWRGHEFELCRYSQCICDEWRRRGFKDILGVQFANAEADLFLRAMPALYKNAKEYNELVIDDCNKRFFAKPEWLGEEIFHASHRSNLLRKNPEHYGKFGWIEPNDLPYVWPVEKENAC